MVLLTTDNTMCHSATFVLMVIIFLAFSASKWKGMNISMLYFMYPIFICSGNSGVANVIMYMLIGVFFHQ